MIPVLRRLNTHKLLLAGDMDAISLASFLNKMLQLREMSRTSGIASSLLLTHLSLIPLPTLPSVPVNSKAPERIFRSKHMRITSRTEMLVFMAMEKGWTTTGEAVGEAEVEAQWSL